MSTPALTTAYAPWPILLPIIYLSKCDGSAPSVQKLVSQKSYLLLSQDKPLGSGIAINYMKKSYLQAQ